VDHLPDEHKADVRRKLQNAYAMADYADAKRALDRLHRELMDLNPSAARSLEEGMEETLTVHKLRVPDQLRRTLSCTNVIESAFSIVETVCRNVKRWRTGDQIERWVGSGLLVCRFRRRRTLIPKGTRTAFRAEGEQFSERSDAGTSIVQEVFGFVKENLSGA
jgi:transposase-like protein